MDKLASIEALVAVVESGGFSRAAERLGLTKSVVSRRIGQLEDALGVQLLQRTTRSQSLTLHGREFYERGLRILADLDDAEQAILDDSAALRGRLKIAGPLSFGLKHLSTALNDFMQTHPAIEIELDLNDREVNLVEEGCDMAVRVGELRDSSLLARRLGTVRFVTCASPIYLEKHGTPSRPEELERHTGLHYTNVGLKQAWQFFGPDNATRIAIPGIRMRANNGEALVAAAIAGMGIVQTPTFIAADHITAGRLRMILQDFRRPATGIHAVYPPGRLIPRRVHALADFLAQRFGDLPYWDQALVS